MTAVDSHVQVPSVAEVAAAIKAFDADWGAVDELLYRACRDHPDHSDRRSIMAKLALIGRTYSAGVERLFTPGDGRQAIGLIGDCLEHHGAEVDAIITGLADLSEPLSEGAMEAIVGQHGRLTTLLARHATRKASPRSFVSKYLHFHNPVVPLYDSYVVARLGRLVHGDGANRPFECPSEADVEYDRFCVRFFRLYEACRAAGLSVTVKTLDNYLWQVPVGPAQPTREAT